MNLTDAEQACLDIYMSIHVSESRNMHQSIQAAWLIGCKIKEAQVFTKECDHDFVDGSNKVVSGVLICTKCLIVSSDTTNEN